MIENNFYKYLPDGVSFVSDKALEFRTIYAPLCGIDANSLKSSITPFLSGDIKIDKDRYLTTPASTEDLRQNVRNFFVYLDENNVISLADQNASQAQVEIGPLWHKLVRRFDRVGLELTSLNFVPTTGEQVEVMQVSVKNVSNNTIAITPTACVPIFGRALENKHDHEHVTSLLHRIMQQKFGVLVAPTMLFNESGHKENQNIYFVFGSDEQSSHPVGTFPTTESFYGSDGNILRPQSVFNNLEPSALSESSLQGKEAVGALRFETIKLQPNEIKEYFIVMGIDTKENNVQKVFNLFNTQGKVDKALDINKKYWNEKIQSIESTTGDDDFNAWMKWVTLQPILRRIFGCSFLPDHDYGKGGKGWRDLWQDLLSLILIEPENVRGSLINNFAGVRIDGSNATIIGSALGEFLADRNAITRVWMDHGVWPYLTMMLYINQTGDYDILFEEVSYFRDPQLSRTYKKDFLWNGIHGNQLRTKDDKEYKGTVLEHLLVQNLVQFFNVGEHNITRLENADWNDGLDMAFERGESVAFMSCYGGNLIGLADLLIQLEEKQGIKTITVAKELQTLLESIDYDNVDTKKELLFQKYFDSVQPEVSGKQVELKVNEVAENLREKGQWIFDHIRNQETVNVSDDGKTYTWFNGYYDNQAKRVEGEQDGNVRMTLTGQVFPIMSGLANEDEIHYVVKSVRRYLKDERLEGYRLNTDFGLKTYLDLGRAFGFAYGTKENGAFFSHMTVMYAYALYRRGFVHEGHTVLKSIYEMCINTEKSKIYPGIPEYFDSQGKGMYHYLTGSASWFVLAQLTQVFGVRGEGGDLILAPKLVKEEFDLKGRAQVSCQFAGKRITVEYVNEKLLDWGEYKIKEVLCDDKPIEFEKILDCGVKIKRKFIRNHFCLTLS